MDQYIGRLLDNRYEILEVIGTGGMAVVYKARCHRLNRLVAIKILKDEFSRDEEFRRRFHAEGEAVAMLSHPNIVQVYDVSSSNNANFIVMELIDGISLKQYMQAKGILNWKETLHFALQIAAGLEHAHSRGIVHRDIKPHNVMVLKNGSVKVMDFGIARVMSKSNTLTKEALGSVHYISPEQAKGSHTDNRSDLYSLGVVMYEMMAGRPPYDGESPVAVAIQHINGGAVVPSNFNPNIPRGLEQIIMKAMALELPDRFTSAGEMLKDMEEFRKNPAIDFHYKSFVDDATRKVPVISAPPVQPRTTAEKIERSKTGTVSQRTSDPVRNGKPAPVTPPVKKQPPRDTKPQRTAVPSQKTETGSKSSRVGMIAIVVCSLVAAFAIILFLVALFNGMLLNRDRDLIEVPNFVGEMYTDDMQEIYRDFQIRFNAQQYDDTYDKGIIIAQEPAAGNGIKVQKGAEIWITISMGEEPAVKMMESLVGLNAEEAASYLKGQGFTPLVWREYDEFYEEGHVIRTDPAEGTELVEGQTIKLVVSRGPQVELQEMPDVTGMDEATARKVLNQLGFSNVETRSAESDRPKGTVIKQSETDGDMIDITTQIILTLSEGPAETTAPEETEAETKPEETESRDVIMDVPFYLPEKDEPYTLTIFCNGWQVTAAREIQPGVTEIVIEMSGSGTKRYDLYINDMYYASQDVIFGQYG